MGLDCYVVHGNDQRKCITEEDDQRLKGLSLCGGMLSGHGNDGSFRGKVYEPLMDELLTHSRLHPVFGCWHLEGDDVVTNEELREQAEALDELLVYKLQQAEDNDQVLYDDTIIYQTSDGWKYKYHEVCDLATLLRVGAERGCVMEVSW